MNDLAPYALTPLTVDDALRGLDDAFIFIDHISRAAKDGPYGTALDDIERIQRHLGDWKRERARA